MTKLVKSHEDQMIANIVAVVVYSMLRKLNPYKSRNSKTVTLVWDNGIACPSLRYMQLLNYPIGYAGYTVYK